jgi:hypothetical protein
MNCIYIKFTSKTFHNIEKWDFILNNLKLYNNFIVYIWIYFYHDTENVILKFIENIKQKYYKCIFISNHDILKYLNNTELDEINKIADSLLYHKDVGKSHLIAYYICKKYKYLINLDGDDMFYPNFDINLFDNLIEYMYKNCLKFLTRPFWICYNESYKSSFGFTISTSDILDYLDIHNNLYIYPGNLDQLFSDILTNKKLLKYNDIHFAFKNYTWDLSETIEPNQLIQLYNSDKTRKNVEMDYIINNNCHLI